MSLLISGFPNTLDISKRVAKSLKVHHCSIIANNFPDGEESLSFTKNPKGKTVVIISSMTHDPDDKLIDTILAAGIAKDYKAKKVILVATYFPYMRQDKHFKKFDSLSSKHIIKLFREFDHIIAIDPHLHRIHSMKELAKKAQSISVNHLLAKFIAKRFKNDFTIVGPDEESAQWSQKIADMLGKKVVILSKTRFSSEHVSIKEKPLGKNVILIDDIISTGHTLEEALKMAKHQNAKKLICIGIHGMLIKDADKRITKYAELITTNTIQNKYSKIDVSPAIVDALKKYL